MPPAEPVPPAGPIHCTAIRMRAVSSPGRTSAYDYPCGGLLLPSEYGGYIHAYDSDDDHAPQVGQPHLEHVPWWAGDRYPLKYALCVLAALVMLLVIYSTSDYVLPSTYVTFALIIAACLWAIWINKRYPEGKRARPLRWPMRVLLLAVAVNVGGLVIYEVTR